MDDVKLSAEWCATEAARCDRNALSLARTPSAGVMPRGGYSPTSRHAEKERLKAQALRIASRVLDEGAEERLARMIADGLGDDLDHAFVNKGEWNRRSGEKGGRYRDINEPMLDDYLDAARAVLAHIRGAG
jgi:hypothetical protein